MARSSPSIITKLWQRWFFNWLDKRSPPVNKHSLTRKNLYIFPSRSGFVFLVVIVVLWLMGTNYQNNLILALAFFLIALFIVSIMQTYANMASLVISFQGANPVFAGENVFFNFSVNNVKTAAAENIHLRWHQSELPHTVVHLRGEHSVTVGVALRTKRRGILRPRRLLVESKFPLGLLRSWTWLNWDIQAIVYPEPLEVEEPLAATMDDLGDGGHPIRGGEDFSGLHEYRTGDSLKHIAWKSYARGQGLFTKEFSQNVSRELWLDYSSTKAADKELKLSGMCYWALEYCRQDEHYGLRLPDREIPPDKGENHQRQVLEALALFELEGT